MGWNVDNFVKLCVAEVNDVNQRRAARLRSYPEEEIPL
jgi:hypothetical protein